MFSSFLTPSSEDRGIDCELETLISSSRGDIPNHFYKHDLNIALAFLHQAIHDIS